MSVQVRIQSAYIPEREQLLAHPFNGRRGLGGACQEVLQQAQRMHKLVAVSVDAGLLPHWGIGLRRFLLVDLEHNVDGGLESAKAYKTSH